MVCTGIGNSLPGLENGSANPPPDAAWKPAVKNSAVSGPDRFLEQVLHFVRPLLQLLGTLRAARFRTW